MSQEYQYKYPHKGDEEEEEEEDDDDDDDDNNNNNNNLSFMELGHLLTRSGLTYREVSSQVYHDSCCQLGSSI